MAKLLENLISEYPEIKSKKITREKSRLLVPSAFFAIKLFRPNN
jgi:hypothetical protein